MVVRAAVLVDHRRLGIAAHQRRSHDMAGPAIDHGIWSILLHHPVGCPELIEDELVHIDDRLEAVPNVFIVVETVADRWSRDTEPVIIAAWRDRYHRADLRVANCLSWPSPLNWPHR